MADPLAERCLYCGSRSVIDDAWWCEKRECEEQASEPAEFDAVVASADDCGQIDTFALLLVDRNRLCALLGDLVGRLHRLPDEQRAIVFGTPPRQAVAPAETGGATDVA